MFEINDFQMPGLRRIAVLDPAGLPPFIRELALSGLRPVVSAPTRDIEFLGDAELSFSMKDGKLSTSLSFSSNDRVPLHDVAFLIEDRMGERRIVGASELPYPAVSVDWTTAAAPGQKRRADYNVIWEGYPPLVTAYMDDDDKLKIRDS